MSLENNQVKPDSKNLSQINFPKEKETNKISQENNIPFKPKPVKQSIINKTTMSTIDNKFPNIPLIYKNPLQAQYLNELNEKINYIKNKEQEIPKINLNEKEAFSLLVNNNNNNKNNMNINYIKTDSNNIPNTRIHCTCKKTKCIKK